MGYEDPVDIALRELPFCSAICRWRPQYTAESFQEAFEVGRGYANALIAFLKKHPDTAPNFLMHIVIDQISGLPDEPLAIQRGYVAGFWERMQAYLQQA
jgi:hypothetical protein